MATVKRPSIDAEAIRIFFKVRGRPRSVSGVSVGLACSSSVSLASSPDGRPSCPGCENGGEDVAGGDDGSGTPVELDGGGGGAGGGGAVMGGGSGDGGGGEDATGDGGGSNARGGGAATRAVGA
eukprot:scaffold1259_cov368-Prasinococcus_capsulatus_cf.AAC.8